MLVPLLLCLVRCTTENPSTLSLENPSVTIHMVNFHESVLNDLQPCKITGSVKKAGFSFFFACDLVNGPFSCRENMLQSQVARWWKTCCKAKSLGDGKHVAKPSRWCKAMFWSRETNAASTELVVKSWRCEGGNRFVHLKFWQSKYS